MCVVTDFAENAMKLILGLYYFSFTFEGIYVVTINFKKDFYFIKNRNKSHLLLIA